MPEEAGARGGLLSQSQPERWVSMEAAAAFQQHCQLTFCQSGIRFPNLPLLPCNLNRLVFLLALALATAANAASTDVVRGNFVAFYTAAGADSTSPRVRAALNGLESSARSYTRPGYLRGDGSWA